MQFTTIPLLLLTGPLLATAARMPNYNARSIFTKTSATARETYASCYIDSVNDKSEVDWDKVRECAKAGKDDDTCVGKAEDNEALNECIWDCHISEPQSTVGSCFTECFTEHC